MVELDRHSLAISFKTKGAHDTAVNEPIGGQDRCTEPGNDDIHFFAWLEKPRAVDLEQEPCGGDVECAGRSVAMAGPVEDLAGLRHRLAIVLSTFCGVHFLLFSVR